jgi:diguanylate cyclase (GGDEF)-like protein/PAS domain S-box-containing protein
MRRWIAPILVSCAAATAAARVLTPTLVPGRVGALVVSGLLVCALVAVWGAWLRAGAQRGAGAAGKRADAEPRYRALFEACGDVVCVYELHGDGRPGLVVEANETACMALGYARPLLLAMTSDELYAPEVRRAVQERMRALRDADSLAFASTYVTSDGHRLPVEVSLRRAAVDGRPLCLAVARDVSARLETTELSRSRSHADELTGLLSPRGFFATVGEARQRARRLGAPLLLLHAELDGLKEVNDRLGHGAGDALVLAATDVLRQTIRDSDVLARLASDEFVALAVLGHSNRERVDWRLIMARFDEAVAAKQTELSGSFVFSLRHASLVVEWEELDHIDELLAATRGRTAPRGAWTTSAPAERVTARV